MAGPLGSGGARNSAKFISRNGGVMSTLNNIRKRFTAPARRAGRNAGETLMGQFSKDKRTGAKTRKARK